MTYLFLYRNERLYFTMHKRKHGAVTKKTVHSMPMPAEEFIMTIKNTFAGAKRKMTNLHHPSEPVFYMDVGSERYVYHSDPSTHINLLRLALWIQHNGIMNTSPIEDPILRKKFMLDWPKP